MNLKKLLLLVAFAIGAMVVKAQDFVYSPVNPAFGGNPYNYSWLLNSANSQNKIQDPTEEDQFGADPLADFERRLNSQILNELSRRLVNSYFGEDGIEEGVYEMGTYQIDIFTDGSGLNVNIFDSSSGGETTVVVPYF
jgi:curli production assembly/transport component CsgF